MTSLAGFPSRVLGREDTLFRIHGAVHNADYFSTSGEHRFDAPEGHSPRYGVCYVALEAIGAYVEVFGAVGIATRALLSGRNLSRATPTRELRVADLTDRSVLGNFGVTAAVSMSADYGEAQKLSARLNDEGFDGILYRARHDPEMRLESVALFDTSSAVTADIQWSPPTAIPEDVIDQGYEFAIEVSGPMTPVLS